MNLFDEKKLTFPQALILITIIASSYNIAALSTNFIGLVPIYFLSLLYLTKLEKYRHTFYLAWIASLVTFSIHINFFLNIFGNGSVILWIILSFWPALFVLLSKFIISRTERIIQLFTIPALFFTIEAICCELYPLRFNWCNIGYMTHESPSFLGLKFLGLYGFALLILSLTLIVESSGKRKFLLPALVCTLSFLSISLPLVNKENTGPRVTGIQLEFPEENEALVGLEKAFQAQPETDIFMLSEYTFKDGIPISVKEWCRKNKVYLLTGTTFKTDDKSNYYNTATIINPEGDIEFKQVKAQPIQFFNDGLPAPEQKLWNSPWGKIGLCICYDLSYARVIDKLVEQGAQALLVPTMDVESWGKSEHELHKRVAPVRAAEYGIPIFKVASSGISQSVYFNGNVIASAPFPGQGEIISSNIHLSDNASKPLDRYLFWPCIFVCIVGFFSAFKKEKLTS